MGPQIRNGVVRAFVATVAVCAIVCNSAQAQNFERYKPKTPPPADANPQIPERPIEPAAGSDQILVARLDAIIVLDRSEKVNATAPHADAVGVTFQVEDHDSLIFSPAARQILDAAIGQPITLRRLNELSRQLILLYRENDQPVVDVLLPEQNITAGTVQIVVIEPTVGAVNVHGACRTDPCWLLSRARCAQPGDLLFESSLKEDLYWLNRSPFRRVELDLKPGADPRTTDVNYLIHEVPARKGYIGYEDTGVRSLALERVIAGFSLGNIFGRDGTIGYQYTADPGFQHLEAHAGSFAYELDHFAAVQVYGSWSGAKPNLPPPLNQAGESWQLGANYTHYLDRTSQHEAALTCGVDFKSTNNNLEFNGANVQTSQAELFQLKFGYDSTDRYDDDEYLRHNHDFYLGPGDGFTSRNTAAAFSTIRANTDPTYWYYRGTVERLWVLPRCWQLKARGVGQAASERLLFSETLGLGGYDSVRGYDQRVVNGDCGWNANFEVGPQPWLMGYDASRRQSLKLYAFGDMGQLFVNQPVAGETPDRFLASTGIGLRYTFSNRATLRLDYGHAFCNVPGLVTTDRIHVGFVSYFGPTP